MAEYTPLRFSPGMFINLGRPAPEPIKTASKPDANSSSTERDFPTTTLVSIFTPRLRSVSTSRETMAFGSRNSGMP